MDFLRVIRPAQDNPQTPEDAADVTSHILTTTHKDAADDTPLQYVSAAQVAYWRRIEVEYVRLLAQLAEVIK